MVSCCVLRFALLQARVAKKSTVVHTYRNVHQLGRGPLSPSSLAARHLSHSPRQASARSTDVTQQTVRTQRADNSGGSRIAILGALIIAMGGLGIGMSRLSTARINTDSILQLDQTSPPLFDSSDENKNAAMAEFIELLGESHVTTVDHTLSAHAGADFSSHQTDPNHVPFCVIYPGSTEDVSRLMKICHRRRIPVTGYSGGTSLEGNFTPEHGGVSIDFGRMDQIVALHPDDLDVVVQPAITWQELNEVLDKENLFFPPDPGPGAMIGGMVATGCSGTNAYRYGTIKDWVINLTVVLADGTVIKTRRRPRKSSAGYDLTRTFVGSEGTLGLVTEATLKVTPKPQNLRVAVSSFKTIEDATRCVINIIRAGVPVAAMELLNEECMSFVNQNGVFPRKFENAPTLFFKFTGTPSGVQESIAQVQQFAKKQSSLTFDFAKDQQECDELWSARKEFLWSVMSIKKPTQAVWSGDVAVPVSRLAEACQDTQDDIRASGLVGGVIGHVGDGNYHSIFMYEPHERKIAEGVIHRMIDRALEMDGTITGEHGVGLVKRDALIQELGADTIAAMRQLKKAFDPLCLLNCDKVFKSSK